VLAGHELVVGDAEPITSDLLGPRGATPTSIEFVDNMTTDD
jgi:hypothetical protein